MLIYGEHFSKVTFFANKMGILRVDLDKINLHDDNNFYEDDPETIIHVRLSVWRSKWWDWCLSEDILILPNYISQMFGRALNKPPCTKPYNL